MFEINNRRYTGSKYKLLNWLKKIILENCEGDVFFDVFAGTGVVSSYMSKYYKKIIMNDFLYSNEIIYKAFFDGSKYRKDKIDLYTESFRGITPQQIKENYFSKNFGGKYFSYNDSKKIGYIREQIQTLKQENSLTNKEYNILLASLLYSADKAANTVGHYDAYRKISKIDDKFYYDIINAEKPCVEFEIYREDANKLVHKVSTDIAFIDPPYNSRQYSRFYHVLENLTKWEKPTLTGTALKPKPENMSEYCRSTAKLAFSDLINNLSAKYIVVTYNNTYNSKSSSSKNKITLEEIKDILSKKGETKIYEKAHPFFNAGKTDLEDHKEIVFITKVDNKSHGK